MILSITGRDRVRFLHNLCTNDIYKLASGRDGGSFGKSPKDDFSVTPSGRSCLAAALNRQGKMVAVFRVWMLAEELLLDTDEPALEVHLKGSAIMDKVVIRQGAAWHGAYLASPSGTEFETPCPPLRTGRAALLRVPGQAMDPARYGAACIDAGWPRWGIEMDSTLLPMEAGLEPVAISYTKGCYLGQEVIQRVKTYSEPPRELKQLHYDGPVPPDLAVIAGGEKVGEVRSSAGRVALALMKKSHAKDGTRVDGAVVRDLPWHHWT